METTTKTTWTIDPMHSEISFKIKHLVISTVTGYFQKFSGSLIAEGDDFAPADIHFEADIASITTNNEQRDTHLRSEEFFDAEKYPKLTFKGKQMEKTGEGKYKAIGDLTIKGVTKEIELDVELGGKEIDPYGNQKAGFEVNGKINRKDFGLNWSATTESGNLVAGNEVKIHLNVQLAKG